MEPADANIEADFQAALRTIMDYPKPGIAFKDITPIFMQPVLCSRLTQALKSLVSGLHFDAIAGIETRGYLFGFALAQALGLPFVIIRKAGKLPGTVVRQEYELEYGKAAIEIQDGLVKPGTRVLIHDDLLATGGTAAAAAELVRIVGAEVAGFLFLIELGKLKGREKLETLKAKVISLSVCD